MFLIDYWSSLGARGAVVQDTERLGEGDDAGGVMIVIVVTTTGLL